MNPVVQSIISAPTGILRGARARFRRRLQENDEPCQDYANALRHLAVKCEFTSEVLEKMVRDQFIFGLRSKPMQDQLLFCGERDGNLSLDQVISVASAGEAFQIMRFNNQHPLEKTEIQDVIGPYLDENSLLTMPMVLTSYQNIAKMELAKPERRTQWLPQPMNGIYKFADFFGPHGLYFSSSDEIQRFIDDFGEEGSSARCCIGCPVFGEGIVQFWGCNGNLGWDCYDDNNSTDLGRSYFDIVIKFLQLFGRQVKVLIWKISESTHESLDTLKSMLSLTPNLRDLWVQRESFYREADNSPQDFGGWPELPYLDTINFNYYEGSDYSYYKGIKLATPLVLAYGSQLTALDTTCLHFDAFGYFDLDGAFQSPLNNVKDLVIFNSIEEFSDLVKYVNWRLRRLVFSVDDCFDDCCQHSLARFIKEDGMLKEDEVENANAIWSLINHSSQSLEELYLNYCDHRNEFLVLFLLPTLQHPAHPSNICKKLRKLVIPSLYLMKVKQVSQIICKRFPNLEHIQLTGWNCWKAYDYHDAKTSNDLDLSGMAADVAFSFDYTFPIDWAQLSAEILVHFWNGLASLKKISVTYDKYPEGEVSFQQTRKLKNDVVITTLST